MPKRTPITEISGRIYSSALDRFTTGDNSITSIPQNSNTLKPSLEKVTFYLPPDKLLALEELKLRLLKENGAKVSRSQLVERAIDLLLEK
ncbi:MAG: hypothetical protein HY664_03230 [Chloroflexi bacterium]|nr:hypothetical protein [Chloroflexota bacterium]